MLKDATLALQHRQEWPPKTLQAKVGSKGLMHFFATEDKGRREYQ